MNGGILIFVIYFRKKNVCSHSNNFAVDLYLIAVRLLCFVCIDEFICCCATGHLCREKKSNNINEIKKKIYNNIFKRFNFVYYTENN